MHGKQRKFLTKIYDLKHLTNILFVHQKDR